MASPCGSAAAALQDFSAWLCGGRAEMLVGQQWPKPIALPPAARLPPARRQRRPSQIRCQHGPCTPHLDVRLQPSSDDRPCGAAAPCRAAGGSGRPGRAALARGEIASRVVTPPPRSPALPGAQGPRRRAQRESRTLVLLARPLPRAPRPLPRLRPRSRRARPLQPRAQVAGGGV